MTIHLQILLGPRTRAHDRAWPVPFSSIRHWARGRLRRRHPERSRQPRPRPRHRERERHRGLRSSEQQRHVRERRPRRRRAHDPDRRLPHRRRHGDARLRRRRPRAACQSAAPGVIAGSLTEVPPASVMRSIAVPKKTGVLNLDVTAARSAHHVRPRSHRQRHRRHAEDARPDPSAHRDLALERHLRPRATRDGDAAAGAPWLDAVIPPVGAGARPSMMPKPRPRSLSRRSRPARCRRSRRLLRTGSTTP